MGADHLALLPQPRSIRYSAGVVPLKPGRLISLHTDQPQRLRVAGGWIRDAIERVGGGRPEIVAGGALPADSVGVEVSVVAGAAHHPQGYELVVDGHGIRVVASDDAGAFYGAATVCQLLRAYGTEVPRLNISDWPNLPRRGVLLDVTRDRVPRMETLFRLVDRLASWKVNQLQLYTEHAFAYRRHPEVWADASPMTGEQILELDAYCRDRFVELVPNQNSFGHLHRWLKLDRYRHLAEAPDGYEGKFGPVNRPFSLCPTDPASLDFLRGLYDELLPHFSSRQFNVGADETEDIGQGRSRNAAEERGVGRVYLEFLLAIQREVQARGRTMQFWSDILLRHPELVPELPHDTIVLDWGYEADHPFEERTRVVANSAIPFYVCPGTSSWQSFTGRSSNAIANLRTAARLGVAHGAAGFLNCDWGDVGHWQPLSVSYLPYAYGAAVAWHAVTGEDPQLVEVAKRHAFDGNAEMGSIAYELGETYAKTGATIGGTSPLFLMLQGNPAVMTALIAGRPPPAGSDARALITPTVVRELPKIDRTQLEACQAHVEEQAERLHAVELAGEEGARTKREYEWAVAMLRHACRRAIWLEGIARGHEDNALRRELADEAEPLEAAFVATWRVRSREGGLADSLRRMRRSFADYGRQ
ncbi:MAG: family 20 glycosylhydrolase [Chloroflexota bacterium]|nr:family 20 glycosylhydrolase [Chloroflexota bacterium]